MIGARETVGQGDGERDRVAGGRSERGGAGERSDPDIGGVEQGVGGEPYLIGPGGGRSAGAAVADGPLQGERRARGGGGGCSQGRDDKIGMLKGDGGGSGKIIGLAGAFIDLGGGIGLKEPVIGAVADCRHGNGLAAAVGLSGGERIGAGVATDECSAG